MQGELWPGRNRKVRPCGNTEHGHGRSQEGPLAARVQPGAHPVLTDTGPRAGSSRQRALPQSRNTCASGQPREPAPTPLGRGADCSCARLSFLAKAGQYTPSSPWVSHQVQLGAVLGDVVDQSESLQGSRPPSPPPAREVCPPKRTRARHRYLGAPPPLCQACIVSVCLVHINMN